MFNQCEEKCSLPIERERVIRLMMSFNEPMIAVPRHSVQPTHAYICTFTEDEGLSVYIYLYLTIEKVGILYRHAEEVPVSEGSRIAEDDAVQFAEDMGFLMDDLRFDLLDISRQEKLLATIPMFISKIPDIQEAAAKEAADKEAADKEAAERILEPERHMSKFRMRAASERIKKNKV